MQDQSYDPDEQADELSARDGLSSLLGSWLGGDFSIFALEDLKSFDLPVLGQDFVKDLHHERVSIAQEKKAARAITCFD